MEQLAYVRDQLYYHWFELDRLGRIVHTRHQLNHPPLHTVWKLAGKVVQFRVITTLQTMHLVTLTDAGLYYVKESLQEQARQEVRIEPSSEIGSPYICMYNETLYIGFIKQREATLTFILRVFRDGAWFERAHSLLIELEQSELVHLKHTEYVLANDGCLHALVVLTREGTDTDCLYYLRIPLIGGEIVWQHIMETKSSLQVGNIALYIDAVGQPHACWVVSNEQNVHFYYKNVNHQRSPVSQYISFDQEIPKPYFLSQQGLLVLMFVYPSGKIQHTRSYNSGERWSPYNELQYVDALPLKFVQSVAQQGVAISPIQLLGIGEPYLRPVTWQDIENPFLVPLESLEFEQLQAGVQHQFKLMDSMVRSFAMNLQLEMKQLAARRTQLQLTTKMLEAEALQLEEKERELMQQIYLSWEEPFSARHIQ